MITPLYVSLAALLICWLTLNVIKARQKNQVLYADGGVEALTIARSAHSNAVETLPIGLILLFALEFNGAYFWLINLLGISLIIGRIIHAKGILSEQLKKRILGMQITIFTIIALAALNIIFLPYGKFLSL